MKMLKFVLPGAVVAFGLVLTSLPSYGTVALSKKEGGAKCVVCHTAAGKKDLNDTGKCYKEHSNSMEACKAK